MPKKIISLVSLLVLVTVACQLMPDNSPSEPDPGDLATIVAATLTSVAQPEATETPAPTAVPPSILRVVYNKAGNVWLWAEGSAPVQLTSSGIDSSPRLSTDGQVVAFARNGEIWAVNSDGSSERRLVESAYFSALPPATAGDPVALRDFSWVPGSHRLFFTSNEIGEAFTVWRNDMHVVDTDSPAPNQIIPDGQAGVPYFSPDSSLVAVVKGDQIYLMSADGVPSGSAFSFPNIYTYSEWTYHPQLVWMSDSSAYRVIIPAQDPLGDPSQSTRLWHVPVSGSPVLLVEFVSVPAFVNFPYLSPNGLRMAYMRENGPNYDLIIREVGGGDTIYTSHPVAEFGLTGWAPDSLTFTYWVGEPRSPRYGRVGSAPALLVEGALITNVRWVTADRFLYQTGSDIRLGMIGGSPIIIDSPVMEYDFSR